MDNLIARTLNFLLVPEAEISVVFLGIFALIFIFGLVIIRWCIVRLRRFSETSGEKYDEVSRKMTPDNFIHRNIDNLSAFEGILEDIPDVFVSVGILATFLGLGVAIQEAASLLHNDDVELAHLIEVLGVIAFKFQTSVWGIALSLVFKKLVVEPYFYYRQKIIDNIRDLLQDKERDSIQILLETQNGLLNKQISMLIDYQHLLERQYDDIKSSATAFAEAMNAQYAVFANNFSTTMMEFKNIFEAILRGSDENYKNSMSSFSAEMEKMRTAAKEFHGESTARLLDIIGALAAGREFISDSVGRYVGASEKFVKIAGEFKDETAKFDKNVKNMENNFVETQEKIGEMHQENLLALIRTAEHAHNRFLSETKDYVVDSQNEIAKLATDSHLKLAEMFRESQKSMKQMLSDSQKSFVDSTENSRQLMSDALTTSLKNAQDESSAVRKTVNTLDGSVSNIMNRVAEMRTVIQTMHNNFNNEHKQITAIQTEFKGNIEAAHKNAVTTNNEFQKFMREAAESVKALESSGVSDITALCDALKTASDKNMENTNRALADCKKLLEQLSTKTAEISTQTAATQRDSAKEITAAMQKFISSGSELKGAIERAANPPYAEKLIGVIGKLEKQIAIQHEDSGHTQTAVSKLEQTCSRQYEIIAGLEEALQNFQDQQANYAAMPVQKMIQLLKQRAQSLDSQPSNTDE